MSRTDRPWTAWILVTAGAVAVALTTLEASSGASAANGDWQQAVRDQTRYTTDAVSNIRKVYVDEAPLVMAINGGLIRADELDRHARPGDTTLHVQAKAERAAEAEYLRRFRAAQGPINELVVTSSYQPGSGAGAPQLGRRLAELQAGNAPQAAALRESVAAAGQDERRVTLAGRGILGGVLIALIGFGLWARHRVKTDLPEPPDVAFGPPEIPAVPPKEPAEASAWAALPPILLGLVAAVVTVGQIQAGVAESRLLADAARRADVLAGAVTGGLIRATFVTNGKQTGLLLGQRADDFRRVGGDPDQAAADDAACARIIRLTADVGVAPTAEDGVDSFTQTMVSGLDGEQQSMRADQERAAIAADAAGTRSDRLVVVLFALTLAATLTEIGRSLTGKRPGKALRRAGYLIAAAAAVYALTLTLVT
jgi:hypothetical protein